MQASLSPLAIRGEAFSLTWLQAPASGAHRPNSHRLFREAPGPNGNRCPSVASTLIFTGGAARAGSSVRAHAQEGQDRGPKQGFELHTTILDLAPCRSAGHGRH